jgi:hypothetical protein
VQNAWSESVSSLHAYSGCRFTLGLFVGDALSWLFSTSFHSSGMLGSSHFKLLLILRGKGRFNEAVMSFVDSNSLLESASSEVVFNNSSVDSSFLVDERHEFEFLSVHELYGRDVGNDVGKGKFRYVKKL